MDASRQGCEIIQGFQKASDGKGMGGTLKEGGNSRSVVTQADIDAQARIVGGLRETWGDDLFIIGEENEEDACPDFNGKCLEKDLLVSHYTGNNEGADEHIPLEELSIFVDPLDGTREFVEGRLQNVACLIGIVRNNRPIAGVIGVPFPDGTTESSVEVHYAIADQDEISGVWPRKPQSSKHEVPESSFLGVTILTGDSSDPVLVNATNCAKSIAKDHRHIIIGGTAAKLRYVATGIENSVAILHFKTELWDTCAAEALLVAKGGKITDLFGSPLVHSPKRPFGNIFGVVASGGSQSAARLHDELCRRMRADATSVYKIFHKWTGETKPEEPQAMDIARDLDGIPFSLQHLEGLLESENPSGLALVAYSVPEADAWRGMMSNGVRYKLDWEVKNNPSSTMTPTSDIFYKRIVMADLVHARDKLRIAPHKLVRDVKSYQVRKPTHSTILTLEFITMTLIIPILSISFLILSGRDFFLNKRCVQVSGERNWA
jgi:3'-phosphoadenosine 5'-phosphosulfate (PAPS) 3'-phosphatase